MVTSDRKIKLIDFGIAKKLDTLNTQDRQLTSAGQFVGKPGYAPPELVLGDVAHQNETTDIYEIGILLFQLITGELPFQGSMNEVMDKQCHAKMPLKSITNARIRRIIARATDKKQTNRFASASEFRVAIEQLERRKKRGFGVGKPLDLKWIKYTAAGVLALAIVSGIFLMSSRMSDDDEEEIAPFAELEQSSLEADNQPGQESISSIDSEEVAKLELENAIALLGDSARFEEAEQRLIMIAELGFPSSARACAVLSFLYSHDDKDDYAQRILGIEYPLSIDYEKARDYTDRALNKNPDCYEALLARSLDYQKPERGFVKEKDNKEAMNYLARSYKVAKDNNNQTFVDFIITKYRDEDSLEAWLMNKF